MEMLSSNDHSDIVSWLDHGKAFRVYKQTRFVKEVFPKYFKESKYTSFTRKLSRWGFLRVSRGLETGAYYHPLFQRGNLTLCSNMICSSVKPPNTKTQPKYHKESNVYIPPAKFSSDTAYALKLAEEVEHNKNLIMELNQAISIESKIKGCSKMTKRTIYTCGMGGKDIDITASHSDMQASIDSLRKRIRVDSFSRIQSNTDMLILLAEQLQANVRQVTTKNPNDNRRKVTKRASAA